MYCVFDTEFYCDGSVEPCLAKFNALLGDLKVLLEKHPDVTCTAFDTDDWSLSADDLLESPESEADLDGDDGEASAG
ncbi:MAG: hypothetical protein HOP29_14300 [Phycisphaerales bacterium]|nr:hypothetical protein [Phycisphaerales bacterium]